MFPFVSNKADQCEVTYLLVTFKLAGTIASYFLLASRPDTFQSQHTYLHTYRSITCSRLKRYIGTLENSS